ACAPSPPRSGKTDSGTGRPRRRRARLTRGTSPPDDRPRQAHVGQPAPARLTCTQVAQRRPQPCAGPAAAAGDAPARSRARRARGPFVVGGSAAGSRRRTAGRGARGAAGETAGKRGRGREGDAAGDESQGGSASHRGGPRGKLARVCTMPTSPAYPIGTPGQAWGPAEVAAWRERQQKQRSYEAEVLLPFGALRDRFDVLEYGRLDYSPDSYPLFALRSRDWNDALLSVLVTGGVHGYETSGVHGAL